MCCAEFIVKYVLFIANVMFTLAGIALIGVGIAVLVQINELLELIPVNINAIPIAIIVLGSIVFAIAFFGCCGAIRESRCLLSMYFVCMGILAAGKIYLAIVIFGALDTILTTVQGWLTDAFRQETLRVPFHVMETLFKCCGTTGPGAYDNILPGLPPSCCPSTVQGVCQISDAFQDGCNDSVGWYFETFGEAIGGVLITIIIFELVAMFFGMFMCWAIGNKRSKQRYY